MPSHFTQWFSESLSLGVCLNEMLQIEHNDLINLWKLMASETLFCALHSSRDSVIVTGSRHEILVGIRQGGYKEKNSGYCLRRQVKHSVAYMYVKKLVLSMNALVLKCYIVCLRQPHLLP